MKQNLKPLVAISLMIWISLAICTCAQGQDVITVVGNHAPPYRIIEQDEFSGMYFDTMKEIGKRIGVEVKFLEVPFKRALVFMKQGKADVMLGPNKTPDREEYMVYTEAFFPPENKAFYVHPDASGMRSYDDLKGKLIAVGLGKSYFPQFDSDKKLKKQVCPNYVVAIKEVKSKKCDVVIMPEREGDYLLKKLNVQLKKSSYVVPGRKSYITISRKSPSLTIQKEIEEAMEEIRTDGTMERIVNRYR